MDDPRIAELDELLDIERDGRLGYRLLLVRREELPLLSERLHDHLFLLSRAHVWTPRDGSRIYRVPLIRYAALVTAINAQVAAHHAKRLPPLPRRAGDGALFASEDE